MGLKIQPSEGQKMFPNIRPAVVLIRRIRKSLQQYNSKMDQKPKQKFLKGNIQISSSS